jgi:flavin-binding protein dodecin
MAVARVTELVSASTVGFDDAVKKGFERAAQTLRNITGFYVTDWRASVENDQIREYRVTLKVTFLLEDTIA